MICQRCQKNPATLYLEESVNGHTKKWVLCADCAEEMKRTGALSPAWSSPFASFFGDDAEDLFSGLFGTSSLPASPRTKRCELCGARWSDIAATGKVGCPRCYDTFADELAPTLYRLHGTAEHRGRKPRAQAKGTAPAAEETPRQTRGNVTPQAPGAEQAAGGVEALKAELKKAIAAENYERAAELRDQIREREGK